MKLHTGIILKNFSPYKSKIALLDDALGRVDAVVFTQKNITVGALMHYVLTNTHQVVRAEHLQPIDIPFCLARADLLFLHHILEICYGSLPIGSCVQGIFELLMIVYQQQSSNWSMYIKKVFLVKLLTTMGIYPETYRLSAYAAQQIAQTIDIAIPFDARCEQELDQWLKYWIAENQYVQEFKTIEFLIKKIGRYE